MFGVAHSLLKRTRESRGNPATEIADGKVRSTTSEIMSRHEEMIVGSPDDELPAEVRELLAELENDRGVQLALDGPDTVI